MFWGLEALRACVESAQRCLGLVFRVSGLGSGLEDGVTKTCDGGTSSCSPERFAGPSLHPAVSL